MSVYELSPTQDAAHGPINSQVARSVALIGLTLALSCAFFVPGACLRGEWLVDLQGLPSASDFVNVWAAGDLALHGHAPDAYNWTLHRAAEVRALGHDFKDYYGWAFSAALLFDASV